MNVVILQRETSKLFSNTSTRSPATWLLILERVGMTQDEAFVGADLQVCPEMPDRPGGLSPRLGFRVSFSRPKYKSPSCYGFGNVGAPKRITTLGCDPS